MAACRMEFGNSALAWSDMAVASAPSGDGSGAETRNVSFAFEIACSGFSFAGQAECRFEDMREFAQDLRRMYEFQSGGAYLPLLTGNAAFSMDEKGHLKANVEIYDGPERARSQCGFCADQSSLRPFLAALERFLREAGAEIPPCKPADFPLDRPRNIRYNKTRGKNSIAFVRWFRERLRRR